MSLTVTKVPRALDNRLRLFGFELADLLLIFLYLSVSNLFFGPTRLKFPIVWCGTILLACVLHFVKKGKPENYIQHLLQFKMKSVNQLNQDIRSFLNSLPDNTEVSFVVDVNSDCRKTIDEHSQLADKSTDIGWVAESRHRGLRDSLENLELVKSDLYLFLYLRPESVANQTTTGIFKKFFQPPSHFQSLSKDDFEKRLHTIHQTKIALIQSLMVTGIECQEMTETDTKEVI